MTNWWKSAVVYQVYPRSFMDASGDGIGDLRGITHKLDYLQNLGVDVIWLSPHFKSPNADNGYDISDYRAVMETFGTMADFDEMLAGMHERGLKLIIDLVVNHSSDEHPWFQEARKSKDNPYRDYYIWQPNQHNQPPNDWISFFSGSAWELDPLTNEYYLHYFLKKQPDLNWENPKLRQEVYDLMRFWLDKGVDGFRMDVISLISKKTGFPDFPAHRFGDLATYANGPKVHEYLREMNAEVLSKYDCMTVGEAFGISAGQATEYVGKNREELNMVYHFDHAVPRNEHNFILPEPEFTLPELKAIFTQWDTALENDGWNTVYFGNHDNPRVLSRFGDTGKFRNESAKMIATLLLTLRGTPYLYQGDEIGMSNRDFRSIHEFEDVQVSNAYDAQVVAAKNSDTGFLRAANCIARDHARTPMQWDASTHAGFSSAETTWLQVNENYAEINVAAQHNDPESILHYYRKLIRLRKETPAFITGKYMDLLPDSDEIWMYNRQDSENTFLIINNFTKTDVSIDPKIISDKAAYFFGNYQTSHLLKKWVVQPFESVILKI